MSELKTIRTLSVVLCISGTFDIFGGIYFSLFVGTGRSITNPATHPFHSLLIAVFLICFGIIQYYTAYNIRRYLFNVGVVILSRVFYGIIFFSYLLFSRDFPTTFISTAIADLIWAIIYIVIILFCKDVRFRDLYLPSREGNRL